MKQRTDATQEKFTEALKGRLVACSAPSEKTATGRFFQKVQLMTSVGKIAGKIDHLIRGLKIEMLSDFAALGHDLEAIQDLFDYAEILH